ncbi:asparagine synthase-related protein [Streptomyces camelliae]|uniref:Asparagine synthase-related protein n=1 Tax=Streptomyces camelliae TaxID=3004093 RepID=A0ABY7P283_9ACTN|nr:asparagine synthase-related protein [Streptomyces sp. HUAS 2-6]WBO64094.1 asparagine synthase-related protein [Streptomyces sp. HUAS 2-6]
MLLTGYGSDLINAGLYRPFDHRDELIDQCLTAVDRTRRSNELSNRMPLAYGTTTHHPFWARPVMRTALDTAPECKVREGREKHHLRTAMGTRLPEPIAWRKKIAVRHGGGLQQGVIRRLERDTGTADRERLYRACFAELLDRAAEGALEPADPWSVLDGAVRRVRGTR